MRRRKRNAEADASGLRAVHDHGRLRIFSAAGQVSRQATWPHGRRLTFAAAHRDARSVWAWRMENSPPRRRTPAVVGTTFKSALRQLHPRGRLHAPPLAVLDPSGGNRRARSRECQRAHGATASAMADAIGKAPLPIAGVHGSGTVCVLARGRGKRNLLPSTSLAASEPERRRLVFPAGEPLGGLMAQGPQGRKPGQGGRQVRHKARTGGGKEY